MSQNLHKPGSSTDGQTHFFTQKIFTQNLRREISVEELADKAELSVSYLSALFKQETGISPIRFIINLRLEKAKIILDHEEFSVIKQVALRGGFNDQSRFIREFKKTYGTSPKNYVKQKWAEKELELEAKK